MVRKYIENDQIFDANIGDFQPPLFRPSDGRLAEVVARVGHGNVRSRNDSDNSVNCFGPGISLVEHEILEMERTRLARPGIR